MNPSNQKPCARSFALLALALLYFVGPQASAQSTESRLRPWPDNPWYWSYRGKPVLLLGGSDDDNLFQWSEQQLIAQLDRLAAAGGNVIRNTMSDRKDKGFETYAFYQQDDGKYDLSRWNDEYWDRFERLLDQTAKRQICIQIEVWDRFDYTDNGGANRWQIHPYNPKNNVNYTYEESGFATTYPSHPGRNEHPFFFTTPEQRDNQLIRQYQQRFVDKLLDHSLKYDHVLYCIDNETSGEPQWARYWAEFIKRQAQSAGKTVFVTEMWDQWDLRGQQHKRTFDNPELYDFVDVSQNNHNSGRKHWDNFLFVREYLSAHPRPINTTKTYGASGNKFGHTDQDAIERFWRHLLAGAASIRFHRPDSGLGLNDKAVACLHAARKLEGFTPPWSVEPSAELLSDCEPNEAYLAARPGTAYAVYFPAGGEATLNMSEARGAWTAHWINIDDGNWGPKQPVSGGERVRLSPPDKGNWAAAILANKND